MSKVVRALVLAVVALAGAVVGSDPESVEGPAMMADRLTGETGHPIGTNQHSQAATATGGLLLQDVAALEKLRRFNGERMAERVVHARGTGAHGKFVSYGDFSNYTAAKFLCAEGIETEVFTRFSTVIHGRDSPETVRDPRGFSVKFYTETEGNYDLVGSKYGASPIRCTLISCAFSGLHRI